MSLEVKNSHGEFPHQFCTGSSYLGDLDEDGKMTGIGVYRYKNGTEYHGNFKHGVFHGRGMVINESKFKMCGFFINGKCSNFDLFFGDGLEYDEDDWAYCTEKDRRFWTETVQGISPVGESFLTHQKPSRVVPRGLYDNEEGFFEPKNQYVLDVHTQEKKRYVCPNEKRAIMDNCRMNAIDFQEMRERSAKRKNTEILTDSWVSSDSE